MFEALADVPFLGGFLSTILPFLIVISIVVAIHEYGHYIVARWSGIHAEVFSIGFGKVLISRVDKHGTQWQIAAIPMGGYVKFLGDADASSFRRPERDEDEPLADRSFAGAPLWARSATVAAGPIANFILAIFIYTLMVMVQGVAVNEPRIGTIPPAAEQVTGLRSGDTILSVNGAPTDSFATLLTQTAGPDAEPPFQLQVERDGQILSISADNVRPPLVVGVRPLSGASRAGIRADDLIVSADGTSTPDFETLSSIVQAAEGREIEVVVQRGLEKLSLTMRPSMEDIQLPDGSFEKRVIIGVSLSNFLTPSLERPGFFEAIGIGARQTLAVITGSIEGIRQIIAGNIGPENLQGPVGIAQVSGETATRSGIEFVLLIAVISTAIGLMNLFPIPMLDGGHLLFNAYEAVSGRQPPAKVQEVAGALGLATVLSLMLFATYNDIARLLSNLVS